MNLFRDLNQLPDSFCHGAVSIGNFDGVHLGHARIIRLLAQLARQVGGPAVVFTFDPHPATILHPERAPTPLTWTERKAQLLTELGADAVLACPTDRAFLQLEARQFFDRMIRQQLDARAMVEGENFFFGHDRSGNIDVLQRFCAEASIAVEVVKPVQIGHLNVSSSRIRSLIAAGDVEQAQVMLGRPYRIRGEVIRGAGRGRSLGFPTANLGRVDTLLPAQGIYAGQFQAGATFWPAAVSVGPNPTFAEAELKIEAYLIGFDGDLYGQTVELDFLAWLRDIKTFGSVGQLTAQMDRDVASACEIFQRDRAARKP
ncbi:MAG: bifunctional riboflavin kinase/FAD synthetase [Pirellulales bacterium]|nr:bifunctional riboflavin kinase/FAD synthetase [Pirellulales bacterium]